MTDDQSTPFVNPDPFLISDWRWRKQERNQYPNRVTVALVTQAMREGTPPTWSVREYYEQEIAELVELRAPIQLIPRCVGCKLRSVGAWSAKIHRNGITEVQLRCLMCWLMNGKQSKQRNQPGWHTRVPVIEDNRMTSCERCGDLGVESHHFAPRHLFAESHAWPTGDLCRPCHRHWHNVMTPHMGRGSKDRKLASVGPRPHAPRWSYIDGAIRQVNAGGCFHCGEKHMLADHHMAPEDMFDDWWAWPTARLCLRCSTFWRETLDEAMAS